MPVSVIRSSSPFGLMAPTFSPERSPTLFRTACILTLCIAASLAAITVAQDSTTEKTEKKSTVPGLTTVQERVSYGIGLNIGRQFKRQNLDIDPSVLVQGIVDVLNDR